jgi:hypothetical protein
MPVAIYNLPIVSWLYFPGDIAAWAALTSTMLIEEPLFPAP